MTVTVLVAYDESPQAEAALEHAIERFPEADIVAIHVTDPSEWIYPDELGGNYLAEEAYEAATESAESLLAEAEATARAAGREIEAVSETGRPAHAIVEYAEANDIDHVVIGTHGRRGLERFLLGSVAAAVAKRSPVSVTMIRTDAGRED